MQRMANLCLKPWPRPKPKPAWKVAEEYFRMTRDGKIKVSLARVSILEECEEEAA